MTQAIPRPSQATVFNQSPIGRPRQSRLTVSMLATPLPLTEVVMIGGVLVCGGALSIVADFGVDAQPIFVIRS